MKQWLRAAFGALLAVVLCAFTLPNFQVTVSPAVQPKITGVTVNPSSCTSVGSPTSCSFTGTLAAVCNVTPCPETPTFALSTGGANITVVQSPLVVPGGPFPATNTCSFTAPQAVGAGNTIVGFAHHSSGANITSLTDNAGHTYNIGGSSLWPPYFEQIEIWYLTNIQGNPTTWTFNFAANVIFCNVGFVEYAGATGINTVVSPVANASSSDPSITIIPTANSVIWAFGAPNTNCPFGAPDPPGGISGIENAGYTLLLDSCASGMGAWSSNSIVPANVAQTLTWSDHEFYNATTCSDGTTTTTGCSTVMAAVAVSGAGSNNANAPTITSNLTANAQVGTAFTYQITATNSPSSFNATGLPGGLSINTSTGVISGTPTTAGTSSITISATNPSGTGSATLSLTVSGSGSETVSVNGSTTGTTVSAGASMTVAVTGDSGNPGNQPTICTPAPTSWSQCGGAGYDWKFSNCSQTEPASGLASWSCPYTAPSTAGNYVVALLLNGNVNNIATQTPFTVTGGGGGGSCPPGHTGACPGSILPPCPGGCTWKVAWADDFTQDTTFSVDQTVGVTNALWYYQPDGGFFPDSNDGSGHQGVSACSQMIDTSTLPGYLSIHAVGTLAWETANTMVCGLWTKSNNIYGNTPACTVGWYIGPQQACVPIPGPVFYEYSAVLAPNQIAQDQICCITSAWEFYFMEARGNGSSIYGNLPHIIPFGEDQGPVEGWTSTDIANNTPHLVGAMIDPSRGYTTFWDGAQAYSGDPDGCSTGGPCYGKGAQTNFWSFGISNACGGACAAGGTSKLYFVRIYQGY